MKTLVDKLSEKLDKLNKQKGKMEEVVFVKNERKEISMYDLGETFTKDQRAKVYALHNFLMENENLSQEELNEVLKGKFFKFAFLRRLNKVIDNLIEELKESGPTHVLWMYQQSKIMKNLVKNSQSKVIS